MTATPLVIGIDPSLTATGIASEAGWTHCAGMPGHRGDTYRQRLGRINAIASEAVNCVHHSVTGLVVMEGPAYSRGADPSAFDRAALWWLIYRGCHMRDIPVAVVTPAQVKVYATGKGNIRGKGPVVDAVARRFPQYDTEGNDNICDAIVLLAMGLDHLGRPLADLPATHRRALERVDWPEGDS